MTEHDETPAPAKPKRKKRASKPKAKPKAAAAPERKADELDGITESECCFDCMPDRCCITGAAVCGHPNKGGLHASFMSKPDVVVRYQRARKRLAHLKTEKKGDALAG